MFLTATCGETSRKRQRGSSTLQTPGYWKGTVSAAASVFEALAPSVCLKTNILLSHLMAVCMKVRAQYQHVPNVDSTQDNAKSTAALSKSLESTRAHLQGQLRSKEAENNRLTVQIKVCHIKTFLPMFNLHVHLFVACNTVLFLLKEVGHFSSQKPLLSIFPNCCYVWFYSPDWSRTWSELPTSRRQRWSVCKSSWRDWSSRPAQTGSLWNKPREPRNSEQCAVRTLQASWASSCWTW